MTLEPVEGPLRRAIEAAEALGLATAEARAVAGIIAERQGYPGELYVLGLAGGTGVGKSSLLNAIAGVDVSPAGARRPTTTSPVALLPTGHHEDAALLLDWLGGAEARTWAGDGAPVSIVDLPDLDSIAPAHAARVDAVLPKIDAVLWVTDPEKYDDAVLHDRYLIRWMPRLARQAIVVNKIDRLASEDVERVCDDLRQRLRSEGLPEVPVIGVSALTDVAPLREWLREGVSAKEVVTERMRRSAVDAARELASAAGIAGASPPGPLVTTEQQGSAAATARDAVLDLIGPRGLRTEAEAAMWAEARAQGGGPIGRAQALVGRGSRVGAAPADPDRYLRRWRERGSLDRASAPIRHALLTAAGALPAGLRPTFLEAADPAAIGERLREGVDAAVSGAEVAGKRPRSGRWRLFGLLQLLATASVAVGVIWVVVLWVTPGSAPTASVELPILGPMPTPAVLIIGGLIAWFVLGRMLRWRARRLGRQWADAILRDVSRGVSTSVDDIIGARLGAMDEARSALWSAVEDLEHLTES